MANASNYTLSIDSFNSGTILFHHYLSFDTHFRRHFTRVDAPFMCEQFKLLDLFHMVEKLVEAFHQLLEKGNYLRMLNDFGFTGKCNIVLLTPVFQVGKRRY